MELVSFAGLNGRADMTLESGNEAETPHCGALLLLVPSRWMLRPGVKRWRSLCQRKSSFSLSGIAQVREHLWHAALRERVDVVGRAMIM